MGIVLTTVHVTFPVVLCCLGLGVAFVVVLRELLYARKQLREMRRSKLTDRWNEQVVFAHHVDDVAEIVRLNHELKQANRLNRRLQATAARWNVEYHAATAAFVQQLVQQNLMLEAASRQIERWYLAFCRCDSERVTALKSAIRWRDEYMAVVSSDVQCAASTELSADAASVH